MEQMKIACSVRRSVLKVALGTGLALTCGVAGNHIVSMSAAMGTETELAGMSYTLDQYCTVQTGGGQTDPEAIVAFHDITNDTASPGTTAVSGTAVSDAEPGVITAPGAMATPKPESEYANVGISIAADYVNIRKKPTTESTIIGKLYRGSAATISKTVGDWVYIKSGSVSGYIMKDYLAIGYSAEKLIDEFGTKWATVTTETLKVREEKNTECTVLTLIPEDESYEVISEDSGWAKIRVDGDTTGYVSKEYVNITVQFKKAVSIEEEREEERRREAARAAAEKAEREAEARRNSASSQSSDSSSSSGNKSSGSSSGKSNSTGASKSNSSGSSNHTSSNGGGGKSGKTTSSNGGGGKSSGGGSSEGDGGSALGSGDGSAIASYGLQFVGNPYVYGGTSLTHGTDCSGFTMSVFRKFGISLPRTASEQSRVGKKISPSNARPGDLIFYASGGHVNHVALCIGGGRVVHASNSRTGIITSNMYYRTPYCARRILN